jgi:hypothetical protein
VSAKVFLAISEWHQIGKQFKKQYLSLLLELDYNIQFKNVIVQLKIHLMEIFLLQHYTKTLNRLYCLNNNKKISLLLQLVKINLH